MSRNDPEIQGRRVCQALCYRFADPKLLTRALTHRSYRNEHKELFDEDNERLEFLGDSFIGMCVAKLLFDADPEAREGELTRKRAALVCEGRLAAIARSLDLDSALLLGKGEERSKGRDKPRLLASAFEAVIGAVLLDAGPLRAMALVEQIFGPLLADTTAERDYKSLLQEAVQARSGVTPSYRLQDSSGPDHDRVFYVVVCEGDMVLGAGQGRSKSEAERAAAEQALQAYATSPCLELSETSEKS